MSIRWKNNGCSIGWDPNPYYTAEWKLDTSGQNISSTGAIDLSKWENTPYIGSDYWKNAMKMETERRDSSKKIADILE